VALAACAASAIALAARSSSGGVSTGGCRGVLIPAYLPAAGLATIAEHPMGGDVVVVNPTNGPGPAPEPGFRSAIAALQRSGARVLGYVHTGWGGRDAAAVLQDTRRYRSWYGVDGVVLDEAAEDDARLPYYRALAAETRASGLRIVALNPGTVPARGYFDVGDIVVSFEGPYAAYADALSAMPEWMADVPRARVAHLIYGATREDALAAAAAADAGFVYATSGGLPDPWSALPSYLEEFEVHLGRCA
jgi:hypothetical protein